MSIAKGLSAEVAVVGGGPSGLIAALALASSGAETLLIAPPPQVVDQRTTALLDGSIRALLALDVWNSLAEVAAPLKFLRLIDATKRILRAPEVLFDAAELGLEAFGYNVENECLKQSLLIRCRDSALIRIIETPVVAVEPDDAGITLRFVDSEERVSLVAAADGRKSICRRAAGIGTHAHHLPQTAIVLNLEHSAPHNDTSTEFHTESGPFTLTPLKGNRSSLVCVVYTNEVRSLSELDDRELGFEIERRADSILGKMKVVTERGIFPLGTETATHFAARRIALIGEAAHVFPPIGAQGLNLGIRDAAMLAELVAEARQNSKNIGAEEVLKAYDERRRGDIRSRSLLVDLANRSLMTDFLPVHAARGLGLFLASRLGIFRRALMREGLAQNRDNPRLVRGETF